MLEYDLKRRPLEANIVRQSVRARIPIPKEFANSPELASGEELYYNAFWQLRTCATGENPIPWRDVQYYAETYGFPDYIAEDLHFVIRKLDEKFIGIIRAKSQGDKPGAKGDAVRGVGKQRVSRSRS